MSKGLKRVALYFLLGLVAFVLAVFTIGGVVGYQEARGAPIDADGVLFWAMGAVAVAGVLVILASMPQAAAIDIPVWFSGRNDPAAYAATGAAGLALFMVAGYTLAWVWWWWKRR